MRKVAWSKNRLDEALRRKVEVNKEGKIRRINASEHIFDESIHKAYEKEYFLSKINETRSQNFHFVNLRVGFGFKEGDLSQG